MTDYIPPAAARSGRLKRAALKARAALAWEALVPVIWPLLALIGLYAVLTLLGLWDAVGDPWRAFALAATLGLYGALLWRQLQNLHWPEVPAALRRVEEDSELRGRPFEALSDHPVLGGDKGDTLWRAHQARMSAAVKAARARRPKAALAAADGWGARGGLVLAILLGGLFAGDEAGRRMTDAFGLRFIVKGGPTAVIEAWIDPPDYTGRPPIFLASGGEDTVDTPEGSTFVARVTGARSRPRLIARGEATRARLRLDQVGEGVFEARQPLTETSWVRVISGGSEASWTVTAVADQPPIVGFAEEPDGDPGGELEIAYAVRDDYGVTELALEVRLADGDGEVRSFPIDIAGRALREAEESASLDFAPDRWAGLKVQARLSGRDGAGQLGTGEWADITLPERIFTDPVAKVAIEHRRMFLNFSNDYAPLPERPALDWQGAANQPEFMPEEAERRIGRAPEALQQSAALLRAVTDAPAELFSDPMMFLGLEVAQKRLERARSLTELEGHDSYLWGLALRAELGDLADAERALRAAERTLADALARGAGEDELARLFENYQNSVDRYMEALRREALEEGRVTEGNGGQGQEGFGSDEIQELLDAIREASELGAQADARRALQTLSELLRNLEMTLAQGGGGDGEHPLSEMDEALREALEELGGVIGEQRELMDETFDQQQGEQGQQGQQGQSSGQPRGSAGQPNSGQGQAPEGAGQDEAQGRPGASSLADRQGELGEQLEGLRGALGQQDNENAEGGGALSDAERAMEEAERALGGGDLDSALESQREAIQSLRGGAEAFAREYAERLGDEDGQQAARDELDPLGRPAAGGWFDNGDDVDASEEMERRRARDILEELRRRAAEAGRPTEELDYLERLLDRFGAGR